MENHIKSMIKSYKLLLFFHIKYKKIFHKNEKIEAKNTVYQY